MARVVTVGESPHGWLDVALTDYNNSVILIEGMTTDSGWTVELYREPSGRVPVAEFLANLNEADHAAVTRMMTLLEK